MAYFDPFREIETLRRELDRAFTSAFGSAGNLADNGGRRLRNVFQPGRAARSYPLLNVAEDEGNLYVEALAPGVDAESLNIHVLENTLTISGEKKGPEDVANDAFHRNERSAGRFTRSIKLPVPVNEEAVQAEYQNGQLRITLPKSEKARPRKISVNVAG